MPVHSVFWSSRQIKFGGRPPHNLDKRGRQQKTTLLRKEFVNQIGGKIFVGPCCRLLFFLCFTFLFTNKQKTFAICWYYSVIEHCLYKTQRCPGQRWVSLVSRTRAEESWALGINTVYVAVVVVSSKMRSFGFDFVEIFVSKVRKYQRHCRVQTNDIGI